MVPFTMWFSHTLLPQSSTYTEASCLQPSGPYSNSREEVRGQGVKEDNQLIQHHNEENYEDEEEE